MEILPLTGFSNPLISIDDQIATQENFLRVSRQLPSFIQAVIRTLVGHTDPIIDLEIWIPNDDVCVCPWSQASFLGINAEYFGRIGAHHGHKLIGRDPALDDSLCPQDGHALLNSRQAIGYLGEIICAQFLAWDSNLFTLILDGICAIEEEGA